jgi:arabinan endo-1,5-alpha-L-arabinosidase
MFYISKKSMYILIAAAAALTGCSPSETPGQGPPYQGFRPVGDESLMADPSLWGELNVHDPAIFRDGKRYYVFSTDASYGNLHPLGIQMRQSRDLITWEYRGSLFPNVEEQLAEPIAWGNLNPARKDGFWAPDIIKVDGVYRLYFSASTFGSTRSCIALAEARRIEGPYTYRGIVVKSEANSPGAVNCIDPGLIRDANGKTYMTWGSFFGGIMIAELDRKTGMLKEGPEPVLIAGGQGAALEGPCIIYLAETGYYYLFVSYGSLSRDYNIRAARSKSITGPYLDARGNDMKELAWRGASEIGVKLMGGWDFSVPGDAGGIAVNGGIKSGGKAPGHNSVLAGSGGMHFLAHHVRSYHLPDYWFYMQVRPFFLNSAGWPVVMPHRYYGEKLRRVTGADLAGDYALIEQGTDSNSRARQPQTVQLRDGVISGLEEPGAYRVYRKWRIELDIRGKRYDGVCMRQYDWERERWVMVFSASSDEGLTIWGSAQ